MHNSITLLITSVMILTALAACDSAHITDNQESLQVTQSQSSSIDRQADTRIVILDNDLRERLVVHTPTLYRSGRGPLQIDVPIACLEDKNYLIEYRFRFFGNEGLKSDEDESEAEEEKSWKKTSLEAMAYTHLKAKAPDSLAQNFRLEIRTAQ